jgi:hypothetical protein
VSRITPKAGRLARLARRSGRAEMGGGSEVGGAERAEMGGGPVQQPRLARRRAGRSFGAGLEQRSGGWRGGVERAGRRVGRVACVWPRRGCLTVVGRDAARELDCGAGVCRPRSWELSSGQGAARRPVRRAHR